jgi:hypothetical protein
VDADDNLYEEFNVGPVGEKYAQVAVGHRPTVATCVSLKAVALINVTSEIPLLRPKTGG